MLLVNDPVPVPSEVQLSLVSGSAVRLQHTPRDVTAEPPSSVTSPPLEAEVPVMADAAVVVTVGSMARVVKVRSAPYDVPELFVA